MSERAKFTRNQPIFCVVFFFGYEKLFDVRIQCLYALVYGILNLFYFSRTNFTHPSININIKQFIFLVVYFITARRWRMVVSKKKWPYLAVERCRNANDEKLTQSIQFILGCAFTYFFIHISHTHQFSIGFS